LAALNKLIGGNDMRWAFYAFKSSDFRRLIIFAEKRVLRFCGNDPAPSPIGPKGNKTLVAHNAMRIAFQNCVPRRAFGTSLNPMQKLV